MADNIIVGLTIQSSISSQSSWTVNALDPPGLFIFLIDDFCGRHPLIDDLETLRGNIVIYIDGSHCRLQFISEWEISGRGRLTLPTDGHHYGHMA